MEEKEKNDLQNKNDDVVFAGASDNSPSPDETEPDEKQEDNQHGKRKPLFIAGACAAAAIVCIGTIAAVVAINANKNAVEADTVVNGPELSETYASVPDYSLVSAESSEEEYIIEESSAVSEDSKTESKEESKLPDDITFGKNVSVEGVDVSGMSLAKAHDALQGKVESLREPVSVTVVCEGNRFTLTQDDMIYDSNLSEVLLDAYRMSKGKQKDSDFDYTKTTGGHLNFSLKVTLSADSIDNAVNKIKSHFDIPAVNAHVKTFDPTKVEKFTYEDGHDGRVLDRKEVEKQVRKIFEQEDKSGSFSIELKKSKFTVTLADIKANTKLIASHCTTAANVYNSNHNMQLAILSANGTKLMPGEVFSFNDTTGNTENGKSHDYPFGVTGGYLPSIAYTKENGETVTRNDIYGGGICQASTTIYICALKAGLQVVERTPHAYASSYADRGLDATIDYYGGTDMKFKNTLKYPIYIATYVYDYNGDGYNEIMAEIYGPLSTEYDEVVPKGWVTYADYNHYYGKGAQVYFKNGKEIKRVFLPVGNSYDYRYDSYYTAASLIPADPENGPAVSPTNSTPTVYSPGGCGSNAPIPYGTAEEYLKKVKEEASKPESSKQESSKQESSKQESSKQESSKQESSKQESSKQESSKQESSKQESSKQESSKQESSKQESSKQESSKQESSKQEFSKQESSVQESSVEESVTETTTEESD